MIILQAEKLTHKFPDGTVAIKDIDLAISEGEFIVIAGSNGSGKTVFARHLNGLLKPTSGKILFFGEALAKNIINARKQIGLIFQNSDSQIVGQTVAEDVAFGPENLKTSASQVAKIVAEALEAVDLSQYAKQNPQLLSGGQKRKLAVAGVLAMKPKVIVFDEPFTGLDYPGVRQVLKQLVELHKSGHTIVLITHELEKTLAHADRLVVMDKGRIVLDGLPEEQIYKVAQYGIRLPEIGERGVGAMTWLS
ncbi:MAG: ATP-binding cassette domain-containing protein [Peptococcaceae bacterium]|nr:ATP-binding cassette domain-containing protein [Peptococcaceae bacterium]